MSLAGLGTGRLDGFAGPKAAHELVRLAVARLINERPKLRVPVNVVAPDNTGTELLSGQHELGPGGLQSRAAHEMLCILPLRTRRLYMVCRSGHPLAGKRPTNQQVMSFPPVTVVIHGAAADAVPHAAAAGFEDQSRQGVSLAVEVISLELADCMAAQSDVLFPGSLTILRPESASGHPVMLDYDAHATACAAGAHATSRPHALARALHALARNSCSHAPCCRAGWRSANVSSASSSERARRRIASAARLDGRSRPRRGPSSPMASVVPFEGVATLSAWRRARAGPRNARSAVPRARPSGGRRRCPHRNRHTGRSRPPSRAAAPH